MEQVLQESNKSFKEKLEAFSRFSIFFLALLSLIVIGTIADSIVFAKQLINDFPLLGYIYIGLLSFVVYLFLSFIVKEFISFLSVSKASEIQKTAIQLVKNPNIRVYSFVDNLIGKYGTNTQLSSVLLSDFQNKKTNLKVDEVLPTFSEEILSVLDVEAEKTIFKYAKENGVVTAISPIPLVDTIFLIWRNIRMVNELSKIYGFRPRVFSNFLLLKRISEQLIFIGVTELSQQAVSILSGQTLTSKLSSSLSQGLGHAVLTVRIGLATIQTTRPIPLENETSLISKFVKSFNPFKKSCCSKENLIFSEKR